MRKEKYNKSENWTFEGDDIGHAFECNGLSKRLEDIDVIVAEVCGANDEYSWYWILQMKDGTFSWAQGNCDYTGWDCQSSSQIHDGFKTPELAIADLKIDEYESRTGIKECLLSQIKEETPFALFTMK